MEGFGLPARLRPALRGASDNSRATSVRWRKLARAALLVAAALGAIAGFPISAPAQTTPKVSLDSSEALFAVMSAINTCGYDDGLAASNPLRQTIRKEVNARLAAQVSGDRIRHDLCEFYNAHRQDDPARELAQYVSLGVTLGPPPVFASKLMGADLPPDAAAVADIMPLVQTFYQVGGLRDIWQRHSPEYEAILARHHDAVVRSIDEIDAYLRMPISGYLGRSFVIYVEPLAAPERVNARNYGQDYFLVLSPNAAGTLNLALVPHIYLHYILDPLVAKHPTTMARLEGLLPDVIDAPMDASYKHEVGLLVTESLIDAIQARRLQQGRATEDARQQVVNDAEAQGFILTRFFYDQLIHFEKEPTGLQDAFTDMLAAIDVSAIHKRVIQTTFSARATPDVLHSGLRPARGPLDEAEEKLASGDRNAARQLAEQVLQAKSGDQGRAFFVLARTSADIRNAQTNFEHAIEMGREPRVLAWSHVYLGRIYDLRYRDALEEGDEESKAAANAAREQAVNHYQAALSAGYDAPDLKAAAAAGLKAPYQPAGNKPGAN